MPSFAPKIRVEVYVPIRYEPAYQDTLTWLIEEFTELRGGCTVNENVGVLSKSNKVIDDRVSIVYSDFPMNWDKQADRPTCSSIAQRYKASCLRIFGKKRF